MAPRRAALAAGAAAAALAAAALAVAGALHDDALPAGAFEASAVYDAQTGDVVIEFEDATGLAERVRLEVLGMSESFVREYDGAAFSERVAFGGVPANGWRAHPAVIEVDHPELGAVGVKVEVADGGAAPPALVYRR